MRFNLLSDNKRIVIIAMFVGTVMIWADAIMENQGISGNFSLLFCGLGFLVLLWSTFSHIYAYSKKMNLKPSRIVGNLSFMISVVFWGIFLTWIYVKTQ